MKNFIALLLGIGIGFYAGYLTFQPTALERYMRQCQEIGAEHIVFSQYSGEYDFSASCLPTPPQEKER